MIILVLIQIQIQLLNYTDTIVKFTIILHARIDLNNNHFIERYSIP